MSKIAAILNDNTENFATPPSLDDGCVTNLPNFSTNASNATTQSSSSSGARRPAEFNSKASSVAGYRALPKATATFLFWRDFSG
jgi:hypothetical protein